jgi:hypothetical protein
MTCLNHYVNNLTQNDIKTLYYDLRSFIWLRSFMGSRGSVVGIATGYGLDDRGVKVQVPVGSTIFSSPRR